MAIDNYGRPGCRLFGFYCRSYWSIKQRHWNFIGSDDSIQALRGNLKAAHDGYESYVGSEKVYASKREVHDTFYEKHFVHIYSSHNHIRLDEFPSCLQSNHA